MSTELPRRAPSPSTERRTERSPIRHQGPPRTAPRCAGENDTGDHRSVRRDAVA